ncbi:MAG: hypothetical protein H7138_13675 [Myxococcales bacterium]|nr:hypothetical protein [Myxococcales bacterium]
MSLYSVLYATNPSTPEAAIAAAFPEHVVQVASDRSMVQTNALRASARPRTRPNFDLELLGFEPAVSIYFAIDKDRSAEARQQLAAAIRAFLDGTSGDVALTYLDTLVLKRLGDTAICAASYADMLPNRAAGWTIVPELAQPE